MKTFFISESIRHADTIAICRKWKDGDMEGEEVIAEVLPGEPGCAQRDAEFIVEACNAYIERKEVIV